MKKLFIIIPLALVAAVVSLLFREELRELWVDDLEIPDRAHNLSLDAIKVAKNLVSR